jgi:hypothetical protein
MGGAAAQYQQMQLVEQGVCCFDTTQWSRRL